ncbi:MAG: L-serine ammonia-lyase [Kiritimatiellae bacterium]|nr:L-serine ammonia-lyase [Kiritimatiellia bacterium]
MESIRRLYKVGLGPSSSHTMGPLRAAQEFSARHPEASRLRVSLYGSLAATGKGHMTDKAIERGASPLPVELVWKPETVLPLHPNGMTFESFDAHGCVTDTWEVYSIGGGFLKSASDAQSTAVHSIYPLNKMDVILGWCKEQGKSLWEYVLEHEGEGVFDHLREVWSVMKEAVERGLEAEGVLPGGLGLQRKALNYYQRTKGLRAGLQSRGCLFAYALAVAEENAASTGLVVTAPTCGAAGVLPAVLYYCYKHQTFTEKRILYALATAGLIGVVVKKNGSISGAEVGCQGEIGVACAMAAGAATQLFGGSPAQIEYAAEMGLEHHLGLTCDPVNGLVQIPCVERNAFAAARAMDANLYASLSDGVHRVSFDKVVKTMLATGRDLPSLYRETSTGGLAKTY